MTKSDQKPSSATISVEWGYETHAITLSVKNWSRVKRGLPLKIRGKGYWYEGEFFWDYWDFGGGLDGHLWVSYGEDGGEGFDGKLSDAEITESSASGATGVPDDPI
jgi:hypothetical protein